MSSGQTRLRAGVQTPWLSPGPDLMKEISDTPQIKEEPEKLSVKQEEELPDPALEHREETQGEGEEDVSSETEGHTEHSSDTDNDVNIGDTSEAEGTKEECPFCQKTFARKRNLLRHIRIHTGERPYSCSLCESAFAQKYALDSHMRTHTGEKPFSCSICKTTFAQKATLNAHIRLHTGERPYSCSICEKAFTQQMSLKRHMRTHSCVASAAVHSADASGRKHQCPVCKKRFWTRQDLQRHAAVHTGEKPYSCSLCSKAFVHTSNLNAHMRTHGSSPRRCSLFERATAAAESEEELEENRRTQQLLDFALSPVDLQHSVAVLIPSLSPVPGPKPGNPRDSTD